LLLLAQAVHAVRRFELTVGLQLLDPDCSGIQIATPVVNGQYPGPALRVLEGEPIEVLVHNALPNATTTIHFHGIGQNGSPEADGVPYFSQQPIQPGGSFLHRFTVHHQVGTFFYHAHVGYQEESVQGPFIVHARNGRSLPGHYPYRRLEEYGVRYDAEEILMLGEWWHQSQDVREDYLLGPNFVFDAGSDSVLMNGRTIYNETTASPTCQYTSIHVQPNKKYRLRVIGGQSFRFFGLRILGHTMTIIEVDGEPVKPYETDFIEIATAQRFSVILDTHNYSAGSRFIMALEYRWRGQGPAYTENGYGYLEYDGDSDEDEDEDDEDAVVTNISDRTALLPPIASIPENIDWIWPNLESINPKAIHLHKQKSADRTLILRAMLYQTPQNTSRYLVNGRPPPDWSSMGMTLLEQMEQVPVQREPEADGYDPQRMTYPIYAGEVVDLVFQNAIAAGDQCIAHPWHTHGHSHVMVATGAGDYIHEIHKDVITFTKPLYKDVSTIYPNVASNDSLGVYEGVGCGWTKVRILADNPGVWATHCHITSHMLQGKMAAIEERPHSRHGRHGH
ncbi:Cupredoxin, partial [Syncephalastrum racemosum]